MDLRQEALRALACADLDDKVAAALHLHALAECDFQADLQANWLPSAPVHLPGRPALPRLIKPSDVPSRSPFTEVGRAALLHAICHIEFNAINLALDAVWRFANLPQAYYRDWLCIAAEEAHHFQLLHQHLRSMGHRYGDFDAHDGMWLMCDRTAHDVVARMALVPRTLEARGLDATPLIQAKLRKVGTPDALAACDILDLILREEIGHVAIGNHWFRWLCEREGLDPIEHYGRLVHEHSAPRLRPPFNLPAREQAGFSAAEIDFLLADFSGSAKAAHLDISPPAPPT